MARKKKATAVDESATEEFVSTPAQSPESESESVSVSEQAWHAEAAAAAIAAEEAVRTAELAMASIEASQETD